MFHFISRRAVLNGERPGMLPSPCPPSASGAPRITSRIPSRIPSSFPPSCKVINHGAALAQLPPPLLPVFRSRSSSKQIKDIFYFFLLRHSSSQLARPHLDVVSIYLYVALKCVSERQITNARSEISSLASYANVNKHYFPFKGNNVRILYIAKIVWGKTSSSLCVRQSFFYSFSPFKLLEVTDTTANYFTSSILFFYLLGASKCKTVALLLPKNKNQSHVCKLHQNNTDSSGQTKSFFSHS